MDGRLWYLGQPLKGHVPRALNQAEERGLCLLQRAAPDLFPLLNNPDEETRNVIGGALHYRLSELDALMPEAGWQGWHWARSRAYTALNRRRAKIEQYEPQQYFWRVPID